MSSNEEHSHRFLDENLGLRPLEGKDAPELFAIFERNRDYLSEWQDWPNAIQTTEGCQEFILRQQSEYIDGKTLGYGIVFQDSLVGMCTLSKIVPLLRKAHLGYWLAHDFQGKGIATKSCQVLIAHAFTTMKLNRIAIEFKHASKESKNARSRRMAERLGFTEEGVLRQAGMTKGRMMDMVVYSLLAKEWREMQSEC